MNFRHSVSKDKKQKIIWVRLVTFGVILYLFVFQRYGFLQMGKMIWQKHHLIQKIGLLRQENERLHIQEGLLQTDVAAIEKVAREKYFLAKEGERIFKVVPQK